MNIKTALATFLGRYKTALFRKLIPGYRHQRGIQDEIRHWDNLFSSQDRLFADPDFRNRADPDRKLQPELAELLPPSVTRPSVLDVGCGPLSTIGIVYEHGRIDLVGADPLSDEYLTMLNRIGVTPNCRLATCAGQSLASHFGENTFDVVASINALDHTESPKAVFSEMVKVCKPGGFIYLFHAENEGLHERYRGMHQWNFRLQRGQPVASDGRSTQAFLEGLPGVVIHSEHTIPAKPRPLLQWVFRKL